MILLIPGGSKQIWVGAYGFRKEYTGFGRNERYPTSFAIRQPKWPRSDRIDVVPLIFILNLSVVRYFPLLLYRPPPPIQDTYSMFGVPINNDDAIIQSLESQVTLVDLQSDTT